MRLWLVRHAAVQLAPGICYGASDVPADPEHTAACAQRLAQALPEMPAVRCSPLGRCRNLADALQARRPGLQAAIDPRLAEMDFGHWEGQPWDGIGAAALAAWTDDFAQHRPGGGEPLAEFLGRVGQALQATAALGVPQALWITHAGVIKAVRWLLADAGPITRADQWPTDSVACGDWCVLELPAIRG
ncbi:histidine phosphatase family protein [Pseudorhodoferax sp.]|uniref:histidine phosphatase family protein n=1 Tax=Pseudorhodoferax sp. TaxID=1993553 RepID=UPI002DD68BD8|nr:histidine phosphatase family protein [Pseudorhodoferax sp.]